MSQEGTCSGPAVEVIVNHRATPSPSLPALRRAPLPDSDALVCSYCGAVSAFDAGLGDSGWAAALAGGFVVHRHRLVLFGRCAECRAARAEVLS
jgi:Fe2+ or Zn2+ uptake regulation protein